MNNIIIKLSGEIESSNFNEWQEMFFDETCLDENFLDETNFDEQFFDEQLFDEQVFVDNTFDAFCLMKKTNR